MDKTKIYSPRQVAMGAFFGGPLAAVYMLAKNFAALGRESSRENTWMWGIFFTGMMILILPFLPPKFPNIAFPIAYMALARAIAHSYQMSKQAIRESRDYDFQPTLNVFYIAIISAVIFMAVAFMWLFILRVFDKIVLHH